MSDTLPIDPATEPLVGSVRVPGSKSITNRAIVLAALSRGSSVLHDMLRSDDTEAMLQAVGTLGLTVGHEGEAVVIEGGSGRLPAVGSPLRIDCGHGGTPARFLLAMGCLAPDAVTVDGSPRLRSRPMADGIDMLRSLGADITCLDEEGHLPVRIDSSRLRGGRLRIGRTASSQFISALLLVAPFLEKGIEFEFEEPPTSASYLQLTVSELQHWGAGVEFEHEAGALRWIRVRPGMLASRHRSVEPDASSAVYWAVAAAIVPGSCVTLVGCRADDPQPDTRVIEAIRLTGASVEAADDGVTVRGPRSLRGWSTIDASAMPDGAVAMSILAACAMTSTTIIGLETLPLKESDRLGVLKRELERCGAEVIATPKSLRIGPIPSPQLDPVAPPVSIPTYDDHRMAMAFSILGLRRGGISIEDPGVVSKSYPGFFADLERLRG